MDHILTMAGDRKGGPLACVLGDVDLVRALALAGVRSAVVAEVGQPARYSRSAAAALDRFDPGRDPERALEGLLAFGASQPEPPVLFYDGDWDLLLVSRERERLSPSFRFVVAEAELVEQLVDKQRFQALAERLDLPVPRARRVSAGDDLRETGLRFPVVVKPLTRHHDTWRALARGKAMHAEDEEALRSLLDAAGADVDVLVQEAVPGPESRIESYHVYAGEDGEPVAEFTGRKLRTHPPGYGYTTALTTTDAPDVVLLGREITRRLGLTGVAKLDFKRAPEGDLRLLEVNPRFNLWHHPGALAGVNIPELVYRDLTGLPRRPATRARAGVHWCSLAHDLQAARADGVGPLAWARWAVGCDAKSGFAVDDPFPLPRAAIARLRGRLAR
jgi:D-aspartate ligase